MEEKNLKNYCPAIEAMLFVYGEPLEIKTISEFLEIGEEETKTAISDLKKKLNEDEGGLVLISQGNRVQLATKPEFSALAEKMIKSEFEESLTPAALETLAVIAYLGPVSRPKIDYVRGVNSSYTIRNLMLRGLIERVSEDKSGNAFLYQASFDMLKYLGISRVEELPDYGRYRELIETK